MQYAEMIMPYLYNNSKTLSSFLVPTFLLHTLPQSPGNIFLQSPGKPDSITIIILLLEKFKKNFCFIFYMYTKP